MLDDFLGHQHYALNCVHYQQHSLAEPQPRHHFPHEIGVAWRVDKVEEIMLVFEILKQQGDGCGFYRKLLLLLINPGVQPAVGLLKVPVRPPEVRMLDQNIHEGRFAVVEMAGHADISDAGVALGHEIGEILSVVVGLKWLFVVIALLMFGGDQGSLQSLPVFLLDHDLSARIHLLMALVKLLVLVQDNAVLVGYFQDLLDSLGKLVLLGLVLLLGWGIAHNFGADVVSKLVVEVFVVHSCQSIIKSWFAEILFDSYCQQAGLD